MHTGVQGLDVQTHIEALFGAWLGDVRAQNAKARVKAY